MVLTPYTVSHLGDQAYGLLVIAGVLVGYFGLLDFGINTSFTKYISEFYAKQDYSSVNRVVCTGMFFYLVFSLIVVLAGLFFVEELVSLMKIPAQLVPDAVFGLKAGLLIFAVSNLSAPYNSLQAGLQRMDSSNKLGMAIAVLNAGGVVFAIETGQGFRGVMLISLLVTCVRALSGVFLSLKLFPQFALRREFVDMGMFLKLFHFGFKMQVAKISGMISAHLDKLLIVYFLSAGLVTAYQIGNMVVVYAVSIFVLLGSALMPAFSEMHSLGNRGKAIEGYEMGSKYISLMASPVFIFLILCAPRLIYVWMGAGYDNAVIALRILSVGWLINTVLGSVGSAFVQALNKPQVQMRGALLNIFLNPVLSVLLLLKYGFAGAMVGTTTAISLSALYFTWDLHREFDLPLYRFLLSALFLPAFISAACAAAIWLAFSGLNGFTGLPSKIASAVIIGLQAIAFSALYTAFLYYIKPIRRIDADRILGVGQGILRRLIGNFCASQPGALV